ncbi:hypothetical protein LNKW23_22270 [Paralimibaculum aggregatum]|uniref:4Fe-4S ferredoxin-type domain-containing protein n=1 Tax=Paralimibaculum aggregatum TaxID=3036245 RepID=A0ABQ6LIA7_9RHOB|nr:ferredoxin [Limibaculum sp. NKW23]GMG83014.1 hypothetical protein LNKW23_22270 [Limibaculum sp. NKW23]
MSAGRGALAAALQRLGLALHGGFHGCPEDGLPEGLETLLLVGADGPRMWAVFSAAPEAADGRADPLDRWSRRVLAPLAAAEGGQALFPFGGPPHLPFLRWAARGEGLAGSPVGLPVSPSRGLWASYRGALALPGRRPLPPAPAPQPCLACPAPCLTACPVGAMGPAPYDVDACAAHVRGPAGAACRDGGCLVRRACPVGSPPPAAQTRFHIAAFLAARTAGA